jgi:hypothetical protein
MRRLTLVFLTAALFLVVGRSLEADTGTYRILNYTVALTPHSDGTVAIQYYQKWIVTGGHIPWITVGTAGDDYQIVSYGGAVSRAGSASGGGWSGIRLDLDNDYRPGQSFEVSFSIVQRRLFYADKGRYGLDFTPGWYDRASIDTLRVGIEFFTKLDSVRASPPPSSVSGQEMSWSKHGLGAGARFSIHVSFPVGLIPAGIAKDNLKRASGEGNSTAGIIAAFFIIAFVIFIVGVSMRSNKRGYSGGNIFYGGFWGGGSARGGSGGGRSTGGGGGFGGSSISCACACVSCACACACAGGGGAGCSRKLEHMCPICGKKTK